MHFRQKRILARSLVSSPICNPAFDIKNGHPILLMMMHSHKKYHLQTKYSKWAFSSIHNVFPFLFHTKIFASKNFHFKVFQVPFVNLFNCSCLNFSITAVSTIYFFLQRELPAYTNTVFFSFNSKFSDAVELLPVLVLHNRTSTSVTY